MWFRWLMCALTVASLSAEDNEAKLTRLLNNRLKAVTTLRLDRDAYFPGEIATLTITVTNPTNEPLEIPAPFEPTSSGIDLMGKDTPQARELGVEYWYLAPHRFSDFPTRLDTGSIVLHPAVRLERTVRSDEKHFGYYRWFGHRGAVPATPGEYRVEFSYDTRVHVDFRVVQPEMTQFVAAPLPALGGTDREAPRGYMHAFVLAFGGRYAICRNVQATALNPELFRGYYGDLAPLERVGEMDEPVTALRVRLEGEGAVVEWATARQSMRAEINSATIDRYLPRTEIVR